MLRSERGRIELRGRRRSIEFALLLALGIAGFVLPPGLRSLAIIILIYSIYGMAYDLLLGYSNQASLGQSLFFGLGAYGFILPILHWKAGPGLSLGAALLLGGLAALVVGALCVRLNEAYFVIATALIASVVHLLARNNTRLTGGQGGLSATIPSFRMGPFELSIYDGTVNYLLILVFVVVTYVLLHHLVSSPLGRVWVAIRENETRAQFMGYPVFYYKLAAFVVAGIVTALAGAMYAMRLRYASAEFFAFDWSVLPVVWTILGGVGTLRGPILGAALFTVFQYYVSDWWTNYMILFGLLIIVILRWLPRGILGQNHGVSGKADRNVAEASGSGRDV